MSPSGKKIVSKKKALKKFSCFANKLRAQTQSTGFSDNWAKHRLEGLLPFASWLNLQVQSILERFPFEWKNRFSRWETKCRGIPLFSCSPELPENHCTIYFIALVTSAMLLGKNKRFRSRVASSFMFECPIRGFHFEQAKRFLKTQISDKAILPFGHFMYWFLRPVHFP